jgi:Tol biopolymer transport system component
LTGAFRKLRDDVFNAAVSPDSSRIAFLNGAGNEIWLMGPNAENPRRILASQKEVSFSHVEWSPDGCRIAYMKHRRGNNEAIVEILDLPAGQPTVVLSDRRLGSFCWGRDGRILYALAESPPNQTSSNLWEIQPPSGVGRSPEKPRRLTNWAGFNLFYLSLSADGKRLAFVRGHEQSDVYVGELEADGTRLKMPRRFTLDDRIDWPGGWSRDSKTLLFFSDRNGNLDIFRQGIDDRTAEAVVASPEEERAPQLSPDGSWLLYLSWPTPEPGASPASGRLMRIPVSGGPSQVVLKVEGYPGSAQVAPQGGRLGTRGYPDFRCPSKPAAPCILAERGRDQIVFSAFDPVDGKKRQVAKVEFDPYSVWSFWNLSPDGSKIAFGKDERSKGRLRLLPVAGGSEQEVDVKGWGWLDSVAWSADGKSLFVDSLSVKGSSLLHVLLNGQAQVLRKAGLWIDRPTPSPDGRYLAFGEVTSNQNAWMIENFR